MELFAHRSPFPRRLCSAITLQRVDLPPVSKANCNCCESEGVSASTLRYGKGANIARGRLRWFIVDGQLENLSRIRYLLRHRHHERVFQSLAPCFALGVIRDLLRPISQCPSPQLEAEFPCKGFARPLALEVVMYQGFS